MATIKDIAAQVGVSIATVSRVINGSERVNPAIRDAVLQAMDQMNYYPNTIARSLKTESTMSIGMIIQDLSNHHLGLFCNCVEDIVAPAGYLPIIASTNNNPKMEEKFLRHMLERRVDALVVHSCGHHDSLIAHISKRIPTLSLYRRIDDLHYRGDHVDSDNEASVYSITKHLLENGHRKIFIINGPQNISTGTERFAGFCRAMREFGIRVEDDYPYRFDSDFMQTGGMEGCERMLACSERPTALVTTNVEVLIGALKCLEANGLSVPEDISVVSHAQPLNMGLFKVSVTSTAQDQVMLGQRAGQLLLERLKCATLPNREVIFPSLIQYGNSVRNLNRPGVPT